MTFDLRIVLAFLVGGILVTGAFWLRPELNQNLTASAVSANPDSSRNFIQVKDSDKNGIPDWQEPFAIETINLDDLDGADTTTLTGQLVSTLADYLAMGYSTAEEALSLVGSELLSQNVDIQYTEEDINVIGDNSDVALRAYGNKVAEIAISYPLPAGTKDEMTILKNSFIYENEEELKSLEPIANAYEGMRNDMLKINVPSSMVREHLSLVNVYSALAIDIRAFRNLHTDALATTLRYRRYPADAAALQAAISNLYLKLHENGIQWDDTDAVSSFVEVNL